MKARFDMRFMVMTVIGALILSCFHGNPGAAQDVTETPSATQVVTMEGTRANDGNGFVRFVQASRALPASGRR